VQEILQKALYLKLQQAQTDLTFTLECKCNYELSCKCHANWSGHCDIPFKLEMEL
jgi:hypothetical protein